MRQAGLQLLELGADLVDDLDGVAAGLFLDNDLRAANAVREGFLRALLDTVLDAGDILEIDGIAAGIADDQVIQLGGIRELFLDAEGIGIRADVEASRRDVAVLGRDDGGNGRHRDAVSGHLVGIDVDVDLSLRGARHGDRADTGDTGERGRDVVVEDLVEGGDAFGRRRGQDQDRHIVGAELIEHRG